MNKTTKFPTHPFTMLLIGTLVVACGSGRDQILGIGNDVAVLAPTVTAVAPIADASGVPVNARTVTAAFSTAMNPATLTLASFTLACPAAAPLTGMGVSYLAAGNVATLTLATDLPASTVCVATLTTAVQDTAGRALAAAYRWSFTTAASADMIAPVVTSTLPADTATAVAINSAVTASFSEAIDPLTLTAASFTMACPAGTPVAGTVSYAVIARIASFTPAANLPANTVCTARLETAVEDLAGNALALPFTWTFTTGAAPDVTPPTVISGNPFNLSVGICVNKTVNVTFSEAMDPLSITTTSFKLATGGGIPVSGAVAYDAPNRIASFTPTIPLTGTPPTAYTVTIAGGASGVKDLAGNFLAADNISSFTTNASTCATVPALGAAAPFGSFGGSATVTNTGINTVINGDIGVLSSSTSITGFTDSGGNTYTVVVGTNNGLVQGLVYTLTAPPGSVPGAVVTQARADAQVAFDSISPANLPGGINLADPAQCPSCGGAGDGPGELAGRTLPPGIYLTAAADNSFDIGGPGRPPGNLTLDAQGDAGAVWIFQTPAGTGSLNVGLVGPLTPAVPIQILLINGAQARNVFWYVPAGAVIGTGSTVVGTFLADAAITMSTTGGGPPPNAVTTTVNGRVLALTAGVTMTNTVINVPAP